MSLFPRTLRGSLLLINLHHCCRSTRTQQQPAYITTGHPTYVSRYTYSPLRCEPFVTKPLNLITSHFTNLICKYFVSWWITWNMNVESLGKKMIWWRNRCRLPYFHDSDIKWKHFPRCWQSRSLWRHCNVTTNTKLVDRQEGRTQAEINHIIL